MEHYDLDIFKISIIIIIKLKIYFEYHLVKDVLGAPWCTGPDPC